MKKHKANYKKTYESKFFGQYYYNTTPVCDGVFPWNGRSYVQVRNWDKVTCKKCLKIRANELRSKECYNGRK